MIQSFSSFFRGLWKTITNNTQEEEKKSNQQKQPEQQKSSQQDRLNIYIFGCSQIGKSSFCRCFVNQTFKMQHQQTIGIDFYKKEVILGLEKQNAVFWERAGGERFMKISEVYVEKADGIIIAFSLMDQYSFDNLNRCIQDKQRLNPNAPAILVGLQNDLTDNKEQISLEQIQQFAAQNNLHYFSTSAKTGYHVELSVMALLQLANDYSQNNDKI